MINVPRGTKDVLPADSLKWQYVEAKAREACRKFNVKEIRTPAFEHTELFLRSIGEDTDVVGKEMYTFNDKGGRSITLKPEGTAPVARSYIENTLEAMSLPLKMYYFTPVFRYETPQAGRLREHHQFGAEFYGDASPYADFQVVSLAYSFLTSVGIKGLRLNINSIGCPDCRKAYNTALKDYLRARIDGMCKFCRDRLDRNPLRILDCKEPQCQEVVKAAPLITSYLCDGCKTHFDTFKGLLQDAAIPFAENPWIVRGLDYYTRTVFEFITDALGSQGTVCGGGRYDNMVESMGGKPTPCVGFGLGFERLIMLMEQMGVPFPENKLDYFIMPLSAGQYGFCAKLINDLRQKGFSADADFTGRSLKALFKYAEKQNAVHAVVVGENEVASNALMAKRLSDGTVTELKLDA